MGRTEDYRKIVKKKRVCRTKPGKVGAVGRGVASDKARDRSHTEEVRGKGPGAVTGGVRKDDRQNNFRNTFGKLFVWQPGGVRVCVGVVCRVVSKTTGKSWCMGGVDGGK